MSVTSLSYVHTLRSGFQSRALLVSDDLGDIRWWICSLRSGYERKLVCRQSWGLRVAGLALSRPKPCCKALRMVGSTNESFLPSDKCIGGGRLSVYIVSSCRTIRTHFHSSVIIFGLLLRLADEYSNLCFLLNLERFFPQWKDRRFSMFQQTVNPMHMKFVMVSYATLGCSEVRAFLGRISQSRTQQRDVPDHSLACILQPIPYIYRRILLSSDGIRSTISD